MDTIILSFDLDFTLIDNREGIINSFHYALQKYTLPDLCQKEIENMIGTPLDNFFSQISDLDPALLTSAFREYYGEQGIYQVKLLDGVKEKLYELNNLGFKLGVITSKKEEMAIKLLKNLGIEHYFDFIFGETNEIKSKSDLKLKERLVYLYPEHQFVIIGDHLSDRKLAEMLDSPFIGVLTGFHSKEQLEQNSKTKVKVFKSINEITIDVIKSFFE